MSTRSPPSDDGMAGRSIASSLNGSGSVTVNVEPASAALSAVMRPPISSTRLLVIERPSPVPPYRRVVEGSACVNFSNSDARRSGAMPMPVSATLIFTPASPPSGGSTEMTTCPSWVNFTALAARLTTSWRTRSASP